MLILIIGPSAVGKTTAVRRYAEKYGACTFVNLDDSVAQLNGTETAFLTVRQFGWEKFFQDCQKIISDYEKNDPPDALTLIDVGEGGLWKEVSRAWLSRFKKIALVASPEEVYRRRHGVLDMSLEDAYRYSFSEERMQFFRDCEAVIDCNGLSIEQVVDKMAAAIQTLVRYPF